MSKIPEEFYQDITQEELAYEIISSYLYRLERDVKTYKINQETLKDDLERFQERIKYFEDKMEAYARKNHYDLARKFDEIFLKVQKIDFYFIAQPKKSLEGLKILERQNHFDVEFIKEIVE